MKHIEITDPITKAQAQGIPCQYCGSLQGHYGFCFTLTGQTLAQRFADAQDNAKQAEAQAEPSFTEEDHIAAHGLGVAL